MDDRRRSRRLFDPGNRAGVIVSSVTAVLATAVVARVAVGLGAGVGAPPVVAALGVQALLLLVPALPSVVFPLWDGRSGTRKSDRQVQPTSRG